MADNEEEQHKRYREDARIPCRYGIKCYQKNATHHEKYKHPPVKRHDFKKEKGIAKNKKRKAKHETLNNSPKKKIQKKNSVSVTNKTLHVTDSNVINIIKSDDKHKEIMKETNPDNTNDVKSITGQYTIASLLKECNIDIKNGIIADNDIKTVISHLFLTEMPDDFFQLYEICKNINEKDCFNALTDLGLQLVGPYDVFRNNFLSFKVDNKEALLKHWRYYYDPPEFQTIIKVDGKDGLHFGYWRDEIAQKPVFVAKNKAAINGVIEPIAENVFGAINAYIEEKLRSVTPFEKMRIVQLHQKLKNFAKERKINLDKETANMQARNKKVVAKTLHKAGIVVPYNKKTELGYRSLAVTDNELQKILEQIKQAPTAEARKSPMSKLEEVIRLATIAADECDFGTCLELGHSLFASGVPFVENKALNMLSLAYTLLQRPQFVEIAQAHLKDRSKCLTPSVLIPTSTTNE